MRTYLIWTAVILVAASATAQTTTNISNHNDGVSGAVPVYSGASTLNSGSSSAIYQSGGNVGIGTTAPSAALHVAAPWINYTPSLAYGSASSLIFNAAGVDLAEGVTCGPCSFWMQARNYLNGAEPLSVNPLGGNVGIATTGPVVSLDVVGPSGNSGNLEGDPSNSFDIETGRSVGDQILYVGNDKQNHNSYIQSVEYGITTDSLLLNARGGNVGIGTTNPQAKLEINGGLRFSGDAAGAVQTTAWTGVLCGGDYAESVDVTGQRDQYEPGDVLLIDPDDPSRFVKASEPYSSGVAGVYSTKPGVLGRRQTSPKSSDEIPMAVVGIVPVKVSAENGPIRPRDLLVSAATPGYAMKGTDRTRMLGSVIGKAMGSLDSGTGVIEVLVTLQ